MHSWRVNSPGAGITEPKLSHEPLATEGEATPGPDHINPFDEWEAEEEAHALAEDVEGGAPEFAGADFAPFLPEF